MGIGRMGDLSWLWGNRCLSITASVWMLEDMVLATVVGEHSAIVKSRSIRYLMLKEGYSSE